ncbi:MAG: PIN domain-containing protein [Candidatus Eremiobacteraeota bacterium]|nr:PIN domain-containing protein [Candidatus Eremiobacteraeota bacterium]
MTTHFCDTSAFYALSMPSDRDHEAAKGLWRRILASGCSLMTTNYVLTETIALIQGRHGLRAVLQFLGHIDVVVDVSFLDSALHASALARLLTTSRRAVSFVDCTSFEFMRSRALETAFAFDEHFEEQGFVVLRAGQI